MKSWVYTNVVLTVVFGALLWMCLNRAPTASPSRADRQSRARYAPAVSPNPTRVGDTGRPVGATPTNQPTVTVAPETLPSDSAALQEWIMQQTTRRVTPRRYDYFLADFPRLDPLVRQRVLEMLYQRDRLRPDIFKALGSGPPGQEALAQATAAMDRQIALLFGAESDKALQLLGLSDTMIRVDYFIGAAMSFADVPLQQEQRIQLGMAMKTVADERANTGLSTTDALARLIERNAKIRSQAAAFLSPQQLEILTADLRYMEDNVRGQVEESGAAKP